MVKFEFIENETQTITPKQKEYLNELAVLSSEIQKALGLRMSPIQLTESTIRFSGVVVNVKYNETELIVKPKVSREYTQEDINEMMRNLYLRIMKTCKSNLNSVVYFTSMATESASDDLFIDCIAQYYLDELVFAVQKLPIVTYFKKEEKRTNIKGKVLIQKELRSPIRDGKTWCRYKQLSDENMYNALLKWCCSYFAERVNSKKLKWRLEKAERSLPVDDMFLDALTVSKLRLPRNFEVYRECFSIAKNLYLYNSQAVKLSKGSKNICGYMINMEVAFENIVCFYAEKYAQMKHLLHISQADTLLASASNGLREYEFHVRPDDLFVKDNYKLVLDAKYKRMQNKDKPSREDFYQMVSSCIAHETHEAILLYPSIAEEIYHEKDWLVRNTVNGKQVRILADTIDIFAGESIIVDQIAKAVARSYFSEVICG